MRSFALQFIGHEGRIGQNVGEHVERQRQIGFHHPACVVSVSAGIEIAADRFDLSTIR